MRQADVVYTPVVASTVGTVGGTGFVSSWLMVEVMFGIAFGIALLGAGLGATPPRALEWPVVEFVYERRGALVFAGIGVALVLLVTLAVMGWSA